MKVKVGKWMQLQVNNQVSIELCRFGVFEIQNQLF